MGHTFYWNEKTSTEISKSGAASAIRNGLLPMMFRDPKPVYDRLITLGLPLVDGRYCNLTTAYAPIGTNRPEKISSFHDQLKKIL